MALASSRLLFRNLLPEYGWEKTCILVYFAQSCRMEVPLDAKLIQRITIQGNKLIEYHLQHLQKTYALIKNNVMIKIITCNGYKGKGGIYFFTLLGLQPESLFIMGFIIWAKLVPYKHSTCILRWNDVETNVSTSFQSGIHLECLKGIFWYSVQILQNINQIISQKRIQNPYKHLRWRTL